MDGDWSVVSCQWSVVSGQWSVVSGQWSAFFHKIAGTVEKRIEEKISFGEI